jgi:hypothetical protein
MIPSVRTREGFGSSNINYTVVSFVSKPPDYHWHHVERKLI